jgi:membrane-associated phospholipid phosphatase
LRPPVFWIVWSCGLALWLAALVLASPYDLPLSRAVSDPQGLFGAVVGHAGEWPGWGVVLAALMVLIAGRRRGPGRSLRPLGWSVILIALINPLAVTQTLKLLWGRVRFLHLSPDLSNYTPFYLPAGPGAGESFPSGHVAMAFVWAPIPFFLWRCGQRGAAVLTALLGLTYGLAVAWGRICAGKHYLTDVTFAGGLALLLAPLLVRWLMGRAAPAGTGSAA